MVLRRWSTVLLALACLVPGLVAAQGLTPLVVGWERFFVITSETTQFGGRPHVAGTVRNEWGFTARRIQLLIEGLDAGGRVTGQTIAWFGHELPPGTPGYFEVPAPPGARHRVSIFAFDWVQAASLNAP
jgi:hypothetical protein